MGVNQALNARESGQPVSLQSGTIVVGQSGTFVRLESGENVIIQSGIGVLIASGAPISIQSGTFVNIGSGIGVVAASGLFVITDSGQRVVIQSGAPVSLQSGLPVNIGSGIGVLIQSGISVNIGSGIGVIAASGLFVITDSGQRVLLQSGTQVTLGSGQFINVGQISGNYVQTTASSPLYVTNSQSSPMYLASGAVVIASVTVGSGLYVTMSGQGVIAASGLFVITDSGQRVVIQSGASVSFQSGLPVNIGSGVGVNIGSGVGVITSISGQAVFVSGTISILSGSYVNLGSNTVVSIGSGIAYQMSGANVIATVSVGSGLYTVAGGINRAINSGGQTILASGVIAIPSLDVNGNLVVMTSGQTANMLSGQALYVQMSGVNAWMSGLYVNTGVASASVSGNVVVIASGISYLMSGANVIATVSVGSGLGVFLNSGVVMQTSGQVASVMVIGGQYRAEYSGGVTVLASGMFTAPSLSIDGDLRVEIDTTDSSGLRIVAQSGLSVFAVTSGTSFPAIGGINRAINSGGNQVFASGVIVIPSTDVNGNLVVMTSGQTANMLSGQALYVQQSGVNATQSGRYILALPLGAGAVTASTFIVNTSAVQLPNTSGREHILQIMDSGVYWIGGVSTTNSGIGFMWQGIPGTDYRSQLTLKIANLNLLYMKSQTTSGKITILSMN